LDEAVTARAASGQEQSAGERIIQDVVHEARHALSAVIDPGMEVQERPLHAARREISKLITGAQSVELATCAAEMRPALLDCKTFSDQADAYLQEALGSD
jgi:hypothetical protein